MTSRAKTGAPLSPREAQALKLAAESPTAHEVAEQMGVQLLTVYSFYREIAIKLGVSGGIRRVIAEAARRGMVELPAEPPKRTRAKRGPYASALRTRLARFYEDNPHEWLSWEDLCVKFDCTKDQARAALEALRATGRLRWRVVGMICVEKEAA